MRFLRDDPGEIRGVLWEIVKSMLGKKECSDALTGQAISFFNTLESTLKLAAQLDGALEMWTYHHCGELIQEGLKFDEQGWIDSMERERRSKASYLGHQRRAKKAQAKGKRKAGRRA
jgi:hypothetical protein